MFTFTEAERKRFCQTKPENRFRVGEKLEHRKNPQNLKKLPKNPKQLASALRQHLVVFSS